jgi:hypothetical protein
MPVVDPYAAETALTVDVVGATAVMVSVLPERAPCLDAVIVQREALYQQFTEPGRGPLPELSASLRPHTVADGQDHVEVVMLHQAPNLPGTNLLNCQVFLDSCLPVLLSFL